MDMKKVILGLAGIVMLALVLVLFVNAQSTPQEVKKPAKEAAMDCGKCPSAASATCVPKTETMTATAAKCDPAKCKELGCDPAKCKEGKCDPATCKALTAENKAAASACCPASATK
jgi:hypothetical protein